jgi:hypothetical protein
VQGILHASMWQLHLLWDWLIRARDLVTARDPRPENVPRACALRTDAGQLTARLFDIDITAASRAISNDLLYKLRMDGNPLPLEVDPKSWSAG